MCVKKPLSALCTADFFLCGFLGAQHGVPNEAELDRSVLETVLEYRTAQYRKKFFRLLLCCVYSKSNSKSNSTVSYLRGGSTRKLGNRRSARGRQTAASFFVL
jgi:hypothetical protein